MRRRGSHMRPMTKAAQSIVPKRVDHRAEAERLLAEVGTTPCTVTPGAARRQELNLALAQVHATLAVADALPHKSQLDWVR